MSSATMSLPSPSEIKEKLQTLYTQEQIDEQVSRVAKEILNDYKDTDGLFAVPVLKGAFMFAADLLKKLDSITIETEFIRVSSYGTSTKSSGSITAHNITLPDLTDKDVLIIEDIVDTGRTADWLLKFFTNMCGARSVKLASLFDKPCRRLENLKEIKPDYSCFEVDDKFIIGYGLDYQQQFRQLPYIAYVDNL